MWGSDRRRMRRHTRRYVRRQMRGYGHVDELGDGCLLRALVVSGVLGFVVAMAVAWRMSAGDRPVVVLAVLIAVGLTWYLSRAS